MLRMGGRAVECTGLENRQGCEPFVGSNPTPSAKVLCQDHSANSGSGAVAASHPEKVLGLALRQRFSDKNILLNANLPNQIIVLIIHRNDRFKKRGNMQVFFKVLAWIHRNW